MARKAVHVPLLSHPLYQPFVARYCHDLTRFCIEVVGLEPTDDQIRLFDGVNEPSARVSVSSGHGTGKSSASGIIVIWHLTCWAQSNTIVVANTLSQIKIGVLKEAADTIQRIQAGPHGWIVDHIDLQAEKISIKGYSMTWWVIPKTAPPGKPEALAGQHRYALLWVIDEASAVSDEALGVIGGSLTGGPWNRMVMMSQPTRTSGLHYRSHHDMSRARGGPWLSMIFNSERSPLVSDEFIKEKLLQYGGSRDDPVYMIKVRGLWPDQTDGYLLGRSDVEKALVAPCAVPAGGDSGWIISVDVSAGVMRDKSVVLVARVSGWGMSHQTDPRRVHIASAPVVSKAIQPLALIGEVHALASTLENVTVLVDVGGVGVTVYQGLRDLGVNVIKVLWGNPPWKKELKELFALQRDHAMVSAAKAVRAGQLSFAPDWTRDSRIRGELIDQASRVPYAFDNKSRYSVASKRSTEWEGLPSPDIFDAVSFLFLECAEYVASSAVGDDAAVARRQQVMSALDDILGDLDDVIDGDAVEI